MSFSSASSIISLSDCWAKTDRESGLPSLTVEDHSLIVGWVAASLATFIHPRVYACLPDGWKTLIAAHDIGKITPGFLIKCPYWQMPDNLSKNLNKTGLTTNHALISQHHLQDATQFWSVSTAGHHGSYPKGWCLLRSSRLRTDTYEGGLESTFTPLRNELLNLITHHFGPLPTIPCENKAHLHLLTGFTILADWIGSNSDWFPSGIPITEESVTTKTLEIAESLGLQCSIKPSLPFDQQFKFTIPADSTPRPIQQTLLDVANEPGLYIVEAPMGMGKTEAALTAAYQLWENNHAKGLYFALPTQLTSNRIHNRIHSFLENTLASDTIQTLIHGNAWLKDDATRQLSPRLVENDPNKKTPENDHNDTDEVLRWFSSSRKQLIAPFGTGTIDQALLSILPARFAALRHFALAGKVIVIDEVHSYDPYMSVLIDRLIDYQLQCGSTIIILSATLTAARRKQILAAAGATETNTPDAYPLITKVATRHSTAQHFPVQEVLSEKKIHLHHQILTGNDEAYWQSIADAVNDGANVVVIRNSVALAQETFRLLCSLLREIPDENKGLIHSRFPQWQRNHNEDFWVNRLGKNQENRPTGSLLVSTQVVEQSVDIDADLLITDLAPTDLILQRIGRLHRHPHDRPSAFTQPICQILHPDSDWKGTAKEIKQELSPHHFIYHALSLWQASCTLTQRDHITLPGEIRLLLESSETLRPDESSTSGLKEFLEESNRDLNIKVSTAGTRDPFVTAIDDQEGRETRFKIKPSVSVILLKEAPVTQNGVTTITPYQQGENAPPSFSLYPEQFSYQLTKSLHQNAVQVSRYFVADLLPHIPSWLSNHMSDAILAIVQEGTTELCLLNQQNAYSLHYHPDQGITAYKNENQSSHSEPEDDWF